MKFYKNNFIALIFILMFISCGTSDDETALEDSVSIEITSFTTSKNQVEISWNLERSNNAIITDLVIFRYSNDEDDDNINQHQIIANLPSNRRVYIDNDVPYLEDLNYFVEATYYIEQNAGIQYFEVQSEISSFERAIVKIPRIPNHIIQDPNDANSYHFLVKGGNLDLFRYNMTSKIIEANKSYQSGHLFYDKIVTNSQDVFVGTKSGIIYGLNHDDYFEKTTFSIPVEDELKSFGFRGQEIHYNDSENWKYFDTQNNETGRVNDFFVTNFVHTANLQNNKMLLINNNYPNFWGTIYDVSIYNNINMLYTTNFNVDFGSKLDKGILHFKQDETEFISTIFGRVVSMVDLSLKAVLKNTTGVNYLYFNYGNNGKLYGAVQNEKLIHVFDDQTYELIETIETKLYPIYPLISQEGEIQCLGRYLRVEYWNYHSGFELFSSHPNYAIEIF